MSTTQGALGPERKVMSLFGICKTKVEEEDVKFKTESLSDDSIITQRDSILLLDIKIVTRDDESILSKPFRFVTINNKFYNR